MTGRYSVVAVVLLGLAVVALAGASIFVYAQNASNSSGMGQCGQMMGMMGGMMGGSGMTPAQCMRMMGQPGMAGCKNMMSSGDMTQCQAMMQ